jgi:hypothetical protein
MVRILDGALADFHFRHEQHPHQTASEQACPAAKGECVKRACSAVWRRKRRSVSPSSTNGTTAHSAVPLAVVTRKSTNSPCRFSINGPAGAQIAATEGSCLLGRLRTRLTRSSTRVCKFNSAVSFWVYDAGRCACTPLAETPVRFRRFIDLGQPIALLVKVSVHVCAICSRMFRAQPPFLRPRAIYTRRVVQKAVDAVYRDGVAARCVPDRLASDFWVKPSEKMVRFWCRAYAAEIDFGVDCQPWVVANLSGILRAGCVM